MDPMPHSIPGTDPLHGRYSYCKHCLHFVQKWAAEVQDDDKLDPFSLVEQEVQIVSERLRHSVVSSVPALRTAAEYFFRPGVEGKRLRPTLAMLMASALSPLAPPASALELDLRPAAEHTPEVWLHNSQII
jgi:geranyl diphosphate synthase